MSRKLAFLRKRGIMFQLPLNRKREYIKKDNAPVWRSPLFFVVVVVFVICTFFYYYSRDLWVSIEADISKITLSNNVAGLLKIRACEFNFDDGKMSNQNSMFIKIGDNEEKINPGQLVVQFPKKTGNYNIVFSDLVTIINNEQNLYSVMYIEPNNTFEDREKHPYALVIKTEWVDKPEPFTRNYDGVIEIAQYQAGIQCNVLIDKEVTLKLPEHSKVSLKNNVIKANEIGIKAIGEKAKLEFSSSNITFFPEIDEVSYSGVVNFVSAFGGSDIVTLIKSGEPIKYNFAQVGLELSSKLEKYPLRVNVRKERGKDMLKTNIWGPIGDITIAKKSLLPSIPQILYNNFSSLCTVVLTTLLAWALNRFSK